ncbi:hypothetical protein ACFL1H_07765 [Nanoarchaeota archaeon]
MPYTKNFAKKSDKSVYPVWEEVSLTEEEEKQQEQIARKENIELMKECLDDAYKVLHDKQFKQDQEDLIDIAIALFEKRASHTVHFKESKAKEKFDKK